ncbi:hypothetical protein D3C80_1034080 [compost metagenome]
MKLYIALTAALIASLGSASAQSITRAMQGEVIDSYTAYIGANDLNNSSGTSLTKPWQIIRQDRANYHVYDLRDPGDEGDEFFSDARNRQSLEEMLNNGSMSAEAQRMIQRGDCWITVKILGQSDRGTFLVVDVWE